MKFYHNHTPKIPVLEYIAQSYIATHFFQCPFDWGKGDVEYMILYDPNYEVPPNDYFSARKLPYQIMRILPIKERKAQDAIMNEKIEKAYLEMERKRQEKLAQKKGKR